MAKMIKKNYEKITVGSEKYDDLKGFTEVSAEVGKKGVLGITDTNGSKRVRLSSELNLVLDEPQNIMVLMSDTQVALRSVPEGTSGSYEVRKGATIYSSTLAERIMSIAKTAEFKENATTRCGSIRQIQTDENGAVTVILNFD